MDLQIEKEKLKEYAKKVKGVLWLLGTTFAAFLLYVIMLAVMFGFMVNPESPDDWHTVSDAVVFGGIIIPLLLPMAILYWRKIRLGTTATKDFTALCTISLIMCLCAELAFFSGTDKREIKKRISFILHSRHQHIIVFGNLCANINIILVIGDFRK